MAHGLGVGRIFAKCRNEGAGPAHVGPPVDAAGS
jgi:hypothetical protein